MNEALFNLPTACGNYLIHGRKRYASGNKAAIVHIHGMTHNMNHLLEVQASDYFTPNGYDHITFNLYGRAEKSRTMPESTLSTHIADAEVVLEHIGKSYDTVYLIAHSLAGLCTLIQNPKVTAISLWDPSFDVTHFWNMTGVLTHKPAEKTYHLNYGNVFVLGEDMVTEIAEYPHEKCLKRAERMQSPVQLVIPEESIFNASPHSKPEDYIAAFQHKAELIHLPKANHTFSKMGNAQALFAATEAWFKQF